MIPRYHWRPEILEKRKSLPTLFQSEPSSLVTVLTALSHLSLNLLDFESTDPENIHSKLFHVHILVFKRVSYVDTVYMLKAVTCRNIYVCDECC